MQYTPHYNLNLPEGTDIVNPLIQDNPNYTAIDTALYNNKLRVVGTATHVKTGTNHAITLGDSDINQFKFVATGDYSSGDTFSVDGVTVTARIADGSSIPSGAFKINSTVVAALDGTILNLVNITGTIDPDSITLGNGESVEDALAISSGTVTFDANWGGSVAALKKFGHVFSIWLRYQTGLSSDFTSGVIAHIPAGFIPDDGICIPCVKLDSSGINVTGSGFLAINNVTGDVAYYGDPFRFQEYIQANGSWINA